MCMMTKTPSYGFRGGGGGLGFTTEVSLLLHASSLIDARGNLQDKL